MGALATLWDRVASSALAPFAAFEDGLQVPLDAVVATELCRPLRDFFGGDRVLWADATVAADWSFAAQRYLESGRARPGARVASADPHAMELGAYAIAAFHHTPAPLLACAREGFERLHHPRRTLVRINDSLPGGVDPIDVDLWLSREAGPSGFAGAVVEFAGEGLAGLDLGGRRRLCGAAAATGCVTALCRVDEVTRAAWEPLASVPGPTRTRLDALAADDAAPHDELVVVNAAELAPLVRAPGSTSAEFVDAVPSRPVATVLLGGCVGGDTASLAAAVGLLERKPPQPGVQVWLVPATPHVEAELRAAGFCERAERVRARIAGPAECPRSAPEALATSPCLAPAAALAGLPTCVASAHAGRWHPGGSTR